jgi:uncharacterized phiE125 gp8 family phage protein
MEVEVVLDLAAEPVTLAEAKAYLGIDGTDHDGVLPYLITTARQMMEKYSGYSFGEKTLKLYLDEFNNSRFALPYGPVASVTAVSINGDAGELDTHYELTANKKIKVLSGYKDLVITYKTKGYNTENKIPAWMKGCTLAQLALLFEHRGDELQINHVGEAAQTIASPFMILNIF